MHEKSLKGQMSIVGYFLFIFYYFYLFIENSCAYGTVNKQQIIQNYDGPTDIRYVTQDHVIKRSIEMRRRLLFSIN